MKAVLGCFILVLLVHVAWPASITSVPERADVDCQSCEYIMKFIRFQTLSGVQSVDSIRGKLRALFKIVPTSVQNEEYLSNVEKYVKTIRDGVEPQTICRRLSRCSSDQLELPRITECAVCTAVVDLIKFEITVSNATIEVIIKAVEELCAILGDVPVYEECKLILKELNQIIQWIEQKLTPEDICVKLGFCNKTITTLVTNYLKGQLSPSSMLCDLCTMVVQMIDSRLENLENTLDSVETELNDVCDALGDLATQCKSVVDLVLDEMKRNVLYLEEKLDPSATCKKLYLCSS